MRPLRAAFLVGVLQASAAHGGDLDCSARESAFRPYGWLYPPPAAELVEAARPAAAGGAVALLDEVALNGDDRILSYIAWIEGRGAADALGSLAFTTQPDTYAEILARVRLPDGTERELAPGDVSCQRVQNELRGIRMGPSFAPKRYVIHFAGLGPGGLLQYQIALRHHRVQAIGPLQRRIRAEGEAVTWTDAPGDQFTTLIPLGESPQQALHEAARNPRVAQSQYPALRAAWVFLQPLTMRMSARTLPANARVSVTRRPGATKSDGEMLTVAWTRAALPEEPGAPRDSFEAGVVVTRVDAIEGSSYSSYWRPESDWRNWLTKYAFDFFQALDSDGQPAARLAEAEHFPPGLSGRALADRYNRYLRDRVANASGQEIRLAGSFRPAKDVLFGARVASATEKAITLTGLLRSAGIPARLVFVRPAGLPPTIREWPAWLWFVPGRLLVEARPAGALVYYDPASRIPSGAIPAEFQGGEALAAADRKSPEWITLPLSAPSENLTRLELDYQPPADGRISGALRATLSGAAAARFREARPDAPALDERLLQWLRAGLAADCSLEDAASAGGGDPDAALELRARLVCGLGRQAGELRIPGLPLRPGLRPNELVPGGRRRAVDFRVPERTEWRIGFPDGARFVDAPPAPPDEPGYRAEWSREGFELRLGEEFSGLIPPGRAGALRAALARLDAAAGAPAWQPPVRP